MAESTSDFSPKPIEPTPTTDWAAMYKPIAPKHSEPEPAIAPPNKPKKKTWEELKEIREKIKEASFTLRLDKKKLSEISIPTVKQKGRTWGELSGEKSTGPVERPREDVAQMLENLARLPEQLKFQPGITLIVGENGAGKSTLAQSIRLALKHQQMLDEGEDPKTAEFLAYGKVEGEPDRRLNVNDLKWVELGLAPEIARSFSIEELQLGENVPNYYDTPLIIGWKNNPRYDTNTNVEYEVQSLAEKRSHRQTVDESFFNDLKKTKQRNNGRNNRPTVLFFDEPETGMSPSRQRALEQELLDVSPDGSVIIVPTNNIVLFDSDLPRIDLEHPERGIYRPSQLQTTGTTINGPTHS